ncbi:hypothetical protein EON63_24050 [archaeon]|nr:MAG: hypothetical protein EON63_24050 [archaeon]
MVNGCTVPHSAAEHIHMDKRDGMNIHIHMRHCSHTRTNTSSYIKPKPIPYTYSNLLATAMMAPSNPHPPCVTRLPYTSRICTYTIPKWPKCKAPLIL